MGNDTEQTADKIDKIDNKPTEAPLLLWYGHADEGAPLQRVCGLSLVHRGVLAAQKAGFLRVLVGGAKTVDIDPIIEELQQDSRITADVTVETKATTLTEVGARRAEGAEIVIVFGDQVWVPTLLQELTEPLASTTDLLALVSARADQVHPGVLRVRTDKLADLPADLRGDFVGKRFAADRIVTRSLDTGWQTVGADADIYPGETLLLRALGKPADGVVSRNINRKISTAISRRLAPGTATPNKVTAVVGIVGLASGIVAYQAGYWGFAIGAFLYWASAVLDGVDGELSRLKYLGTPLGTWLDTITDDLVGLSFLLGAYSGLARTADHPYWHWIGITTIACYVLMLAPRYFLLITVVGDGNHQTLAAQASAPATTAAGRFFDFLKETVARCDFLPFYAMVASVLGIVQFFAVTYAIGSVLALYDTIVTVIAFTRKHREQQAASR